MKALKIFLIVVGVLLLVAICFGIYIWYQLLMLSQASKEFQGSLTQAEQQTTEVHQSTSTQVESTRIKEPITIESDAISDKQKKLLSSFGIDTSSITITPEMAACAEEKLGSERIDAVIAGAAPTPLEALSLVPCLK